MGAARASAWTRWSTSLRGLMAGGWFEYHGELVDLERCKICPTPQTPIPLLIGGHADVALRRAARQGDGWIHAGGDPAELGAMIERVHALRAEYGRAVEPFEVHAISLDAFSIDGVHRLEDLGVTDAIVGFRYPYTTRARHPTVAGEDRPARPVRRVGHRQDLTRRTGARRSGAVVHVLAETAESGHAREAEVLQPEDVLEAAQQRVVVVRRRVDRVGPLHARRHQQRADAAAAGTGKPRLLRVRRRRRVATRRRVRDLRLVER